MLSASSVTASHQSSAAFSRSLKNGESRHTLTAYSRRSLSPLRRASMACMSAQKAQLLTCETRSLTSSSSGFSMDRLKVAASSMRIALSASGEAVW
ncbi:hypothetical protein D9M71_655510 [compost metagenome]